MKSSQAVGKLTERGPINWVEFKAFVNQGDYFLGDLILDALFKLRFLSSKDSLVSTGRRVLIPNQLAIKHFPHHKTEHVEVTGWSLHIAFVLVFGTHCFRWVISHFPPRDFREVLSCPTDTEITYFKGELWVLSN